MCIRDSIYIYIERGFASVFLLGLAAFGDVISYIRCKDSSRAHIFTLHCASGVQTDLSSNSIQQHGVPAWPAGHPIESQHGLLVVQGSISMACWSSKGVSAWPAGRPSPACLNTRNTVAGELVAPHAGLHRRRKQAADLLRGGAAATICVSMLKFT